MRSEQAQELVKNVVGAFKVHREAIGWSQRALAIKAGVDPKTVNLIERGARSPTLFTLSLLASTMGVPLSRIMMDAENRKGGG